MMNTDASYEALVVDDNWFNRDLSSLALTHVGYHVTEAEDGLQALSLLEKQTFDLLVLDLVMPEMDGPTLLRYIRKHPLHRKMQVVIMTANPHVSTDEVGGEADFVMYKPINVNQFAEFAKRLQTRRVC
ncbi:MAG: response regulator [Anaerolineae bacterium]|nr:response regulator [Anaerolineae bacterium]